MKETFAGGDGWRIDHEVDSVGSGLYTLHTFQCGAKETGWKSYPIPYELARFLAGAAGLHDAVEDAIEQLDNFHEVWTNEDERDYSEALSPQDIADRLRAAIGLEDE